MATGAAVGVDLDVERQRGRRVACSRSVNASIDALGQHRQLAARHVHGRQALRARSRRAACRAAISKRGRGDVDADLAVAVGERRAPRTRRRSRSSIASSIENARTGATAARASAAARPTRGNAVPLRKRLGEEAVEVVVVRRRNRAARAQQLRAGSSALGCARRVERLPFERVLVGPVEQHVELRAQRVAAGGARAARRSIRAISLAFALLALDRRERRLQRVGRRLAVAALALACRSTSAHACSASATAADSAGAGVAP